ncbi:MAG: DUF2130 domain-containing protein [Thermincola sp.]|nr:DUF2130 domain-containing protein [Thermincola sp.]MDT3703287.1 DUF2130 domain-containing protein [Thermincola sp.]
MKDAEIKQKELEFLKQKAQLDERSEAIELEVLRKLEDERQKVKAEAIKVIEGRHRFEMQENEKTIGDLKKIIEDLKAKIEEKSQQKKGEVAEIEIENVLKATFSMDLIEAVPKGVRGADVVQTVRNQFGRECGKIIIESKRTKTWSNSWIAKLKSDQRDIHAATAVLVTAAMPKETERFVFLDGVWVADFETFNDLITVLRMHLIEHGFGK